MNRHPQKPQFSHLTSKFLLKSLDKKAGFTLIELLIVVLILGVLAAVAVPQLISQVGKARESEAKSILGSAAKTQEAYYFEHGEFANSYANLELTFQENYYQFPDPILVGTNTVKHQANAQNAAKQAIRNFSSGIYYDGAGGFGFIVCQSLTSTSAALAPDTVTGSCTGQQVR